MNQVAPVKGGALVQAKRSSLKEFDRLCDDAQWVTDKYRQIQKIRERLKVYLPAAEIENARDLLNQHSSEDSSVKRYIKRCRARLDVIEADEFYDDREELTLATVSAHIAALLGSFPNANPHDPGVYTKLLIEEVAAAQATVSELQSACSKLRRTSTFLPTIAEVLKELKEQSNIWGDRYEAIYHFNDVLDMLRDRLDEIEDEKKKQKEEEALYVAGQAERDQAWDGRQAKKESPEFLAKQTEMRLQALRQIIAPREEQREEARRNQREAEERAKPPLSVGDRVTHEQLGDGTVAAVEDGRLAIDFDNGGRRTVLAGFVARPTERNQQ